MKNHFLFSIAFIALTYSLQAQNTTFNNVSIGTDLPAGGITMKMNFPGVTGAWARGYYISNQNETEKFIGFGAYGSVANGVATLTNAYIGKDWNARYMTFLTNGNIGIGTVEPTANLEIKSSTSVEYETLLKVVVLDAPQDHFKISNSTGIAGQFIPSLSAYHVTDNRAAMYLIGNTEAANDTGTEPLIIFDSRRMTGSIAVRPLFSWDSYGIKKMTLNANGSLGIGTTTTGNHKLAVEGSIGAREIKVQATGWSDFVFAKNYSLPTLAEVEKHIKEKGHLKDIPSEAEVLKNGISLGEMDSKLLQKIEELTLYMIQMKKENEEMKKENKQQSQEINNLKKQISTIKQ